MFISDIAIKRPVLTIVSMLALSVFGIVALFQLNTDEFPEIDAPIVVIAIPYPGASPDVVEREVIEPIEEVISGISGIDRMTSNSLDSFGNIIVEFVFEKDPQQAMQDVRDEISSITRRNEVTKNNYVFTLVVKTRDGRRFESGQANPRQLTANLASLEAWLGHQNRAR